MLSTKGIKTSTTVEDDEGSEQEQVQYRITVPRKITEEHDLGGVQVEWDDHT